MHLTDYVDDTLLRWPGALPAPRFGWWPDWLRRTGDELRALAVLVVAIHRPRASRMRLLQELERLDERQYAQMLRSSYGKLD